MTLLTIIIAILLIGRVKAIAILLSVLQRQMVHIKLQDDPVYVRTRRILFNFTVAALIANIIPMVLDITILIAPEVLTQTVLVLAISSNVVGDLFQAKLIDKLYRD